MEVISVALLAAFVLVTIVFIVGFFLLFACLQEQMDDEEDFFRGLSDKVWILPLLLLCSCATHRDYTPVIIEDSVRIERLVAHPIEPKESSLEAWMECDERGRVLLSKIEELEDDKLSLSLSLDSLGRMLVKARTAPDTIWAKADSVVVYRKEEVSVPMERELGWWERAKVNYGGWALLALSALLVYLLSRSSLLKWIANLRS